MKKIVKIVLLVLGVFVLILLIDTAQALVFDNSPLFKVREYYNGGDLNYKDMGFLVDTWCGSNGNKDTVIKGYSYSISDDSNDDIHKLDQKKLTLERVVELSAKGKELTWSDFEQYECIETGSGLYILVYEIDETFELWIGGVALDDNPMYIKLVTKANLDNCIDIRTEDVKGFIEAN